MKIDHQTLDNGLNVLFVDSPDSTITTAQMWFKAGSSMEETKNHGIAHFLEHMFFKGSKKYPNMKIAQTVEAFGGEINAFTSFDYTCYYINCPADYTSKTVDVLLDMVCNPLFLEKDLIPEREVVFEEYRRSIDNPSQFNFFRIQQNSFTKGYKHPILGNEKNIKNFTIEQLQEFRTQYYNQENSLLIVAGNLGNKNKLIKKINSFTLPSGIHSKSSKFKLRDKHQVGVHEKNVNQTTLTMTIQAPGYVHEDAVVEDLALNCLGFGDISPLYKEMVHKDSIVNSVGSSSMYFGRGGVHFIRFSFPEENFSQALNSFKKVLKDTFKAGLERDTVDRIRNQYVASKIYEKESIESFAFSLGHGFAQTGDIHCEDEFIDKMKKVTKTQVNNALEKIFTRDIHISLQTPKGKSSKDIKENLLNFATDLNKLADDSIQTKSKNENVELSKFDQSVKVYRLKKGITLIHKHNPLTPTFACHAYIKGGLTEETELNNGIYNLIGKNITYGYKGVPYHQLKNELDMKSSYINGFSGRNAYGLTLHALSEYSPSLFRHFFNLLLNPSFPNDYFKMEKELINRSLFIQKEDPVKQCFRAFNSTIFKNHPYAMDIMGNEKSVKKISRKQLQELHAKNIASKELVITYSGDLDFDSVLKEVQTYLGTLKARSVKQTKPKKLELKKSQEQDIYFDREQTHIMIGKPGFKIGSREDFFLKMFTTFLSGQSSDLFVEVRDRQGLCYSVQPLHHSALEAGYWGIYIGSGHDKKDQAIEAIHKILKKYKTKGFKKSEFDTIKNMIQGQNQLNIQTNDDYANFYSIPVLHHLGLDYQHQSFEKIKNLEVEDMNAFLQKFLDDKWITVEVGRN